MWRAGGNLARSSPEASEGLLEPSAFSVCRTCAYSPVTSLPALQVHHPSQPPRLTHAFIHSDPSSWLLGKHPRRARAGSISLRARWSVCGSHHLIWHRRVVPPCRLASTSGGTASALAKAERRRDCKRLPCGLTSRLGPLRTFGGCVQRHEVTEPDRQSRLRLGHLVGPSPISSPSSTAWSMEPCSCASVSYLPRPLPIGGPRPMLPQSQDRGALAL